MQIKPLTCPHCERVGEVDEDDFKDVFCNQRVKEMIDQETAKGLITQIFTGIIESNNAASQLLLENVKDIKRNCDRQCDMLIEENSKFQKELFEKQFNLLNQSFTTLADLIKGRNCT